MTGYEIEGDNRIFSSGVSTEAATSQVASRGQQLPVIPSPAGRVKVGQASALLSDSGSSGSHWNPPK